MKRKRTGKPADPFLRACTACGAREQQPCITVGKDDKPLVSRASRLVHADRLEGDS